MSDAPGRRRWIPAAAWATIMVIATSWPNPRVPQAGDSDKVVHCLSYALLAWLVARAMPPLGPRRLALLLLGLAVFGAVDEWHQAFIPGRAASVADWYADTAGVVLGLLAAALRRPPSHVASAS